MKFFTNEFTIKWDSMNSRELIEERERILIKTENCPESSVSIKDHITEVLDLLDEYIRRKNI